MMRSSQQEFHGWNEDRKDDGWRERNWGGKVREEGGRNREENGI